MSSALHHGKTLVLGLGNDVLTDDAVGLRTVRELQRVLAADPRFDFSISTEMGLTLLDLIGGYDALVLIDSVQTGQAEPGCLHCIPPDAGPSEASRTPHFLGVPETITLGRALGYEMPGKVRARSAGNTAMPARWRG